jgi:hypothetical protein
MFLRRSEDRLWFYDLYQRPTASLEDAVKRALILSLSLTDDVDTDERERDGERYRDRERDKERERDYLRNLLLAVHLYLSVYAQPHPVPYASPWRESAERMKITTQYDFLYLSLEECLSLLETILRIYRPPYVTGKRGVTGAWAVEEREEVLAMCRLWAREKQKHGKIRLNRFLLWLERVTNMWTHLSHHPQRPLNPEIHA